MTHKALSVYLYKYKLNTIDFMQMWALLFNNVSKYDIFENDRLYISIYVYVMFYRLEFYISYKNHIRKLNYGLEMFNFLTSCDLCLDKNCFLKFEKFTYWIGFITILPFCSLWHVEYFYLKHFYLIFWRPTLKLKKKSGLRVLKIQMKSL